MGEGKRAHQAQVLGSQDKIASVDVALALKSVDQNTRALYHTKARRGKKLEEPIYLRDSDEFRTGGEPCIIFSWVDPKEVTETKVDEARELILSMLESGEQYKAKQFIDILKTEDVGKTNIETALKELRDEELVGHHKDGAAFVYTKLPTS